MVAASKTRNFSVSKGLDAKRRKAIDELVEKVRKEIKFAKPPLELSLIEIAYPEVQIIETPNSPVSSEIVYVDKTKRIAQINVRGNEIRQNKVLNVCHALGHYFLHPKCDCACRMDFYGELTAEEAEATYFAETLLMPNSLVTKLFNSYQRDFDPIYKLAKCFSVKRQIMEDRLASLELI